METCKDCKWWDKDEDNFSKQRFCNRINNEEDEERLIYSKDVIETSFNFGCILWEH